MDALLGLGALGLGAILGSFLNALLFRFNTGRSVAHGRSRCMRCSHTLSVLDLVPVFSYLFLRGRCRYCGARISAQYPLVETAAALLALALFFAHPAPLAFAFWLLISMVLLFILVYDLRHTIIPWSASGLLGLLALISLFVSFESGGVVLAFPSMLEFLAGPILAVPLFLLSFVSGGRWMGWGDAPLELGLGWLLGLTAGLTAFLLAVWGGAIVGIGLLVLSKRYTMKSELPFAPFLVLGALAVHLLHVDFFQALPLLFAYW